MHKFVKIAIPILAMLLLNSVYIGFSASIHTETVPTSPYDFPRLDTLYMVEAWPWATALTMAKECKIDVYLGSVQTSAIDDLSALGWTITHSGGGLHYCYFGANCRDYVPAGVMSYDYMGRTPGFSLYPMNVSSFRHALPYIIGCEKTSWLWDILKYIVVRNDFPMPPGFGEWRNPYISEYPEDWLLAEDILIENGFTWSLGADGLKHTTDDIWYMPNGLVLIGGRTSTSPGSERVAGTGGQTGIYVISPGAAPTSVEVVRRHVKKWNSFFTGESVEGIGDPFVLFQTDIIMDTAAIINIVWQCRVHDLFFLCASFGARNPDYLYDTFASTQDVWDGNDDSGISNAGLDKLLYAIKFFMMHDFELLAYNTGEDPEKIVDLGTHYTVAQPADILDVKIERCDKTGVYYEYLTLGVDYSLVGSVLTLLKDISLFAGDALEINYDDMTYDRVITNVDFFRDVVWLADWKIFYLNPQIGVYGRDYFDLFKPGHEGWVNAPGYGAGAYNLPWTFASIHETGIPTGGSMKWQNEGDVVTLNPIKAKWVYEVEILNRIYEGLITRNPYDGTEMPWIAKKITETPVTLPGDVLGEVMRFELRDDVTWQDGTAVNASSIKWNFDYIASICSDIGTPMPEFITIWSFYVNTTIVSPYVADVYVNTTGHWKVLDYAGAALQFPQEIWQSKLTYADRTSFQAWEVPYADIVGHAPPNGVVGLSCLMGTGPYMLNMTLGGWDEAGLAVMSKNPTYWKRLVNPGDINLDMTVNEDDLWYFCARFIDYYKPPNLANTWCDYDSNGQINEDDLWFFCARFIDFYKYGLHGPL